MLSDGPLGVCVALSLLTRWVLNGTVQSCESIPRICLSKAGVHCDADLAAANFLHNPCAEGVNYNI